MTQDASRVASLQKITKLLIESVQRTTHSNRRGDLVHTECFTHCVATRVQSTPHRTFTTTLSRRTKCACAPNSDVGQTRGSRRSPRRRGRRCFTPLTSQLKIHLPTFIFVLLVQKFSFVSVFKFWAGLVLFAFPHTGSVSCEPASCNERVQHAAANRSVTLDEHVSHVRSEGRHA